MAKSDSGKSGRLVLMGYRIDAEIGGEEGERLQELEDKSTSDAGLSREELVEMRRIYETHASAVFLEGPDFWELGVTDPDGFRENFALVDERMREAYERTYFMEAVSLRMLALDFMLRAFIVHKTKEAIKPFSPEDKRAFGQVIKEAKKHGLPEDLAKRLWAFNEKRVSGIHHFVLGRASYQEIGDAYAAAEGLFERIITAMDLPPMEDH